MKLKINQKFYEVDQFTFPGGEVQVRLPEVKASYSNLRVSVYVNIKSSDDLMALILVVSVLKEKNAKLVELHIPYFPYARQDRAAQDGEAKSMEVMASLINSLGFLSVHVTDIHNQDTLKYIEDVVHTEQHSIVGSIVNNYNYIVSPDKGAIPKILKLVSSCNVVLPIILGRKVRNVATGEITGTEVSFVGELAGKRLLIIDDICDGGRTFVELAKVLRKYNPQQIDLYVTHGIFSKGTKVFADLIDNIYTTNSYYDPEDRPVEEAYSTIFNIPVHILGGN